MKNLMFFRAFSGVSCKENHHQEESIQQETYCNIKEKITDSCFVKCHDLFSFTNHTAIIQSSRENTNPNINTVIGGLSTEGKANGMTVDPKSRCPIPINISATGVSTSRPRQNPVD